MTNADIEVMLQNLATTTQHLQDTGRLLRTAAEHLVTASDHLTEIADRTDAAITAGLKALHDNGGEA